MLLRYISETARLLSQDENSSVLLRVPIASKRSLIKDTIRLFRCTSDNKPPVGALLNEAHVRWTMELLSAAFSMDLDSDQQLVKDVLSIYSEWVCPPEGRTMQQSETFRPAEVATHTEKYIQIIFRHITLLFERRECDLNVHRDLCLEALMFILRIGKRLALTEATWDVVLRCMLGIAGYLLSSHFDKTADASLSSTVCPHVLAITYELFFISQTEDPVIWSCFHELCGRVTRSVNRQQSGARVLIAAHWRSVMNALTNRLLRVLYGPTEGSDAVQLDWIVHVDTTIESRFMSDDRVKFLWHECFRLMGDPNQAADHVLFESLMRTLASMVDTFLAVGSIPPEKKRGKRLPNVPYAPKGNDLLTTFGDWLFEAAMADVPPSADETRVKGHSHAIGALVSVFTALTNDWNEFAAKHVAMFIYMSLQVLCSGRDMFVFTYLARAANIFSAKLSVASFCLVKPILIQCARGLKLIGPGTLQLVDEDLRLACLSILSSLNHFPCAFGTLELKEDEYFSSELAICALSHEDKETLLTRPRDVVLDECDTHVKNPLYKIRRSQAIQRLTQTSDPTATDHLVEMLRDITKGSDLLLPLFELYLEGMRYESDHICFHTEAWNFACLVYEQVEHDKILALTMVRRFCELIKARRAQWSTRFYITICQVLEFLACIGDQLPSFIPSAVGVLFDLIQTPHEGAVSIQAEAMNALCAYTSLPAEHNLFCDVSDDGRSFSNQLHAVCLQYMYPHHQSFVEHEGFPSPLPIDPSHYLSVAEKSPETELRGNAFRALWSFMIAKYRLPSCHEQYGQIPDTNSAETEVAILERMLKAHQRTEDKETIDGNRYIRYFGLGNDITIGCMDMETDFKSLFIIRSPGGRHVFEITPSFPEGSDPIVKAPTKSEHMDHVRQPSQPPDLLEQFIDLDLYRPQQAVLDATNPISSRVDEWFSQEREVTSNPNFSTDFMCIHEPPIQPSSQHPNILKGSRLVLAALGLLESHSPLFSIIPGPRLTGMLEKIDSMRLREFVKAGLILVKDGQVNQRQLFANQLKDITPLFSRVMRLAGMDVVLAHHRGFNGGLDPAPSNGKYAVYKATGTTEIMWHVPAIMPTNPSDSQNIHKKRHVGNDLIHVIWNESSFEYRPWTVTSQFNFAHIVLQQRFPDCFADMCTVRVHRRQDLDFGLFGPLLDGMVIPLRIAGPLIQFSTVLANRMVRISQDGYRTSGVARLSVLGAIAEHVRGEADYESTLGTLVGPPSALTTWGRDTL